MKSTASIVDRPAMALAQTVRIRRTSMAVALTSVSIAGQLARDPAQRARMANMRSEA